MFFPFPKGLFLGSMLVFRAGNMNYQTLGLSKYSRGSCFQATDEKDAEEIIKGTELATAMSSNFRKVKQKMGKATELHYNTYKVGTY